MQLAQDASMPHLTLLDAYAMYRIGAESPLAIKVAEAPGQIVAEFTEIVGLALTTTWAVVKPEQPCRELPESV